MKSFPITKEMRADIAQRLTSKAVQTEVDAIDADAKRINKLFWKQYEKKLREASGIPSTKWPELIRIGMAKTILTLHPRKAGENHPEQIFSLPVRSGDVDALTDQLTGATWRKLFSWVTRRYRHELDLKLTASKTMPDMNGGSLIEDPGLIADIEALQERVKNLLPAVDAFHGQTMTVLLSCRTSKQMHDLFPEGAKLLPRREPENKSLAPTELAASVTEMLRTGVPPVRELKEAQQQ